MTVLGVVLYTTIILISLLLIALVLVQQSKGGGLGGAFGGIGESILGGQVGNHLSKLTVILSSIFFVVVIFLAFAINKGWIMKNAEESVAKELNSAATTQVEKVEEVKEDVQVTVDSPVK